MTQPKLDWRDYQRPYPDNNPVLNRAREIVQSGEGIAPADAIRQAEEEMGVSRLDYFPPVQKL